MKMFHKDSNYPIDVHPSRVEEMKRKGWTDTEPKPKKAKAQPTEATTTEEVTEDGNS